MKKLLTYSLAFVLCASVLSSCSEDGREYDFDLSPSVCATFAGEELVFDMITAETGGVISVPMYRGNVKGAASVPVTISGGDGLFTPSKSSFDFADGENVAYIDFSYNMNDLSAAPYTISIVANNEDDIAQTGYGETEFTLQLQLTYNSIGEGSYYSSLIALAYGPDYATWDQEILKADEGNFFLLPDCYARGVDLGFSFDGTELQWFTPSTGFAMSAGVIALNIVSYEVVNTSPLTVVLNLTYYFPSLPQYGMDPYQLGVLTDIITFPEGFSL